jgi:hypothetical protein
VDAAGGGVAGGAVIERGGTTGAAGVAATGAGGITAAGRGAGGTIKRGAGGGGIIFPAGTCTADGVVDATGA